MSAYLPRLGLSVSVAPSVSPCALCTACFSEKRCDVQDDVDSSGPWSRDKRIDEVLRHLGRETRCSAVGLLTVDGTYGKLVFHRSRPVDDLFLRAVQKRLLSSFLLYLGPAATEPEIEVTVNGDAITGPYEPPRSLLTAPVLSNGRVVGMVTIASIYPGAFSSQDQCVLSAIAAQMAAILE